MIIELGEKDTIKDALGVEPFVGSSTPWGEAQSISSVADGIIFVSTASHGGFWLSLKRLLEMPHKLREVGTESTLHGDDPWPGWFEEDCEASAVILGFPDEFSKEAVGHAKVMINTVYPKVFEEDE